MISIIIPVYNEAESLSDTLTLLHKCLEEQLICPYEIIVVDDASTDGTSELLSTEENIKVLNNLVNSGYGYSLKKGIRAAGFDTIMIIDGDGSYPVHQIGVLLKAYQEGYDLVVASREKNFVEDRFFKNIFRMILRWLVEFTAGIRVPDVNSGMRIFSKKTITPYFPYLSDQFSFTTSMTLLYALDKRMILFKHNGYQKRKGKSKVKLFRDMLRTLQFIVEIIALKNPLKLHLLVMLPTLFLSMIGIILALLNITKPDFVIYLLGCLFIQASLASISLQKKWH
jgi:polyisoprenyl-phosphate glycosyltransferase